MRAVAHFADRTVHESQHDFGRAVVSLNTHQTPGVCCKLCVQLIFGSIMQAPLHDLFITGP
jgi:hypothetical protein